MPNLFTARAKARWLTFEIERVAALWGRLGRLYLSTYARMLAGVADPAVVHRLHIALGRVFFRLSELRTALAWYRREA